MHFSTWIWPYARWGGFEGIGRLAQRVEELGFTSITVSDHVVSASSEERTGDGLGAEWPDWTSTSTYLAMVTTRLRVVSCVVIPYRSPLITAKQVATVDQISRGRFTLAACTGWWMDEFRMLGVPFEKRGALTDEYLAAMQALWAGALPESGGASIGLSDISFEPKCWQKPHVPVWIAGGSAPKPLERVAKFGHGWMPMGNRTPEELAKTISHLRQRVADAGRDPSDLDVRYTVGLGEAEPSLSLLSNAIASTGAVLTSGSGSSATLTGTPDDVAEMIARYAEAGVTELAINPVGRTADECMSHIERFAAEIMPRVSPSVDV